MMTPQEVASHSFTRATLGGYSMSMVDEFLDALTEDYTALYNDNAILKNKLKVLSDTVEEYRATDYAMRKTLLSAQQMAESMVAEAEQKKAKLEAEAEKAAAQRIGELRAEIAAEEYRLQQAQETTAVYVKQLTEMHRRQVDFLAGLKSLVPPESAAPADDPGAEIEASVSALCREEEAAHPAASAQEEPEEEPVSAETEPDEDGEDDETELDPEATRRFEDLKFGRDYRI